MDPVEDSLDLGRRHLPVVGHDVHEPTPLARQLGPQLEGAVDGPDVRGGRSAPATHRVHHTPAYSLPICCGKVTGKPEPPWRRPASNGCTPVAVWRRPYSDPDLVGSQRPGQARNSTVLEVKPPLARTRLLTPAPTRSPPEPAGLGRRSGGCRPDDVGRAVADRRWGGR